VNTDIHRCRSGLDVHDRPFDAERGAYHEVMELRNLAGTRVHGTTRQVPRVVFETIEQPTLLPLAPAPFDRPTWAWATVHGDHHIKFRHALYSLPTRYLHQRVEVRADSRLVRLYGAACARLLERDPFAGRRPRYVRAVLYRYRFSDADARQRDGVWWTRERLREYSPVLSLRGN